MAECGIPSVYSHTEGYYLCGRRNPGTLAGELREQRTGQTVSVVIGVGLSDLLCVLLSCMIFFFFLPRKPGLALGEGGVGWPPPLGTFSLTQCHVLALRVSRDGHGGPVQITWRPLRSERIT